MLPLLIYFSREMLMKRGEEKVLATAGLRMHPVATQLLDGTGSAELFPDDGTGAGRIEALPDGTVVAGIRVFRDQKRAARKNARVDVRHDLEGEDPALIAGVVVKDVLAGTSDPLALGAAWAAFRAFVDRSSRPCKGYRHRRYTEDHRVTPARRLERIVRDSFGLGDDQLRRFAAVRELPRPLRDALREKKVGVKALFALSKSPDAVGAVVAELEAGVPPAEAVRRHLAAGTQMPGARTALQRLVRAGARAVEHLTDRTHEVVFLETDERADLVGTQELIGALLRLPSRGDVMADLGRALQATRASHTDAA